ncbi:hypothetical protein [Amycolatopsis anabasis]|uniref:hypothetical protein n=1 Tax=Amycolatopsis anabasis TaxID=1840409 RepID=UPI00131DA4BC|nr:hypothetical protein [Amycolatopsis anabasis]
MDPAPRELRIRLPDLPPDRYATIVHAVASVLDVAGVVTESSIFPDPHATDEDLNRRFDRFCLAYPWSDR